MGMLQEKTILGKMKELAPVFDTSRLLRFKNRYLEVIDWLDTEFKPLFITRAIKSAQTFLKGKKEDPYFLKEVLDDEIHIGDLEQNVQRHLRNIWVAMRKVERNYDQRIDDLDYNIYHSEVDYWDIEGAITSIKRDVHNNIIRPFERLNSLATEKHMPGLYVGSGIFTYDNVDIKNKRVRKTVNKMIQIFGKIQKDLG